MAVNGRNKGAAAEREVAAILKKWTGLDVRRNLEQVRSGGYDLEGIDFIALEVKRCETLALPAWWRQTLAQTKPEQIPVLVYRQNRKQWTWVVGTDKVVMNNEAFRLWLMDMLANRE